MSEPEACEELWWGKRLGALAVSLDRAGADMLADLADIPVAARVRRWVPG